jgi:gustatory receptor
MKIAVWQIGKLFGLFPINVKSRNPREIVFKWISFKTLFSIIVILCCFFSAYFITKDTFEKGNKITMSSIAGAVFFLSVCFGYIILWKISVQLSSLMSLWMKCEVELNQALEPSPTSMPIKKRVYIFLSTYLALAASEHMLAISVDINAIANEYTVCNPKNVDLIATFIHRRMGFLIKHLPFRYNNFVGVFLQYFNFAATMTWNYLDLTIIVLSIGMSTMFEKLNYRIETLKHLIVNEMTWSEVREDYVKVCRLLKEVNDVLGIFVIHSCSNDGYFIVLQLLNIMK